MQSGNYCDIFHASFFEAAKLSKNCSLVASQGETYRVFKRSLQISQKINGGKKAAILNGVLTGKICALADRLSLFKGCSYFDSFLGLV